MEIGDREGPQGKRSKYSLGKGADIQRSGRGGRLEKELRQLRVAGAGL